MKSRCNNCKSTGYNYYWWRWIKCEWDKFEKFYEDMWQTYQNKLTLDRIDWNWNYCKENCRRTTKKVQSNNTKRNRILEFNWKKQNITQRAEELWIKRGTLYNRLDLWWSIEEAITISVLDWNIRTRCQIKKESLKY